MVTVEASKCDICDEVLTTEEKNSYDGETYTITKETHRGKVSIHLGFEEEDLCKNCIKKIINEGQLETGSDK